MQLMRIAMVMVLLLLAGSCAAGSDDRGQRPEPEPPDPTAITVFGRYYSSLESLAPSGVQIGDLALREGRLVIHVQASGDGAQRAFIRALERSGWYRDVRREALQPEGLRDGQQVLSVRPTR